MALIQADRVKELSTTTGSANFTLGGASLGFTSFSAGVGSSNTCYYAASDGSAFEVGLGTVSANVLERTTVFSSSHTSASTVHRVDFQAGSKEVFATYVAEKAVILDAAGDLNITGEFNFATASTTGNFNFVTANSTGNLGVVGNASVGGTFHIQGNTSAQGTLNVKGAVSVSSTLGVEGDITNEVSSITVSSFSKILEIKGGGSNEGGIQLNCRDNSHGQKVIAQPHSEGVTNEMLLPKGANSTLVSEAGTATITNKTYFDTSGGLRQVPKSRSFGSALTTASTTDIGNFIFCAGTASSTQTLVLPSATFTAGDIFSVVNNAKTADSTTTTFSAAQISAVIAGAASATTLITLGVNGVASVLFKNSAECEITGNVS